VENLRYMNQRVYEIISVFLGVTLNKSEHWLKLNDAENEKWKMNCMNT